MNIRASNDLPIDMMALTPLRIACARTIIFIVERDTSGSTTEDL